MVHIFVQSRTRAQYAASWEKGLECWVRIFRRVNPYIIYWRKLTTCLDWGQTVVLRELFYMSVFFIWLWFTLCNDKMILILKWQSYTDLLLIICRFILGKTVVLKWVPTSRFEMISRCRFGMILCLSFWNEWWIYFSIWQQISNPLVNLKMIIIFLSFIKESLML